MLQSFSPTHLPGGYNCPQLSGLLSLIHQFVGSLPVEDPHIQKTLQSLIVEMGTVHHSQLLGCLHQICPQGIIIMELRHSSLLPMSFFGSIPRLLTHSDHSMKHTLGNLPDIKLWQSLLQLMSHLIRGGICFSWFDTTVGMMSIINMGNLLLLILSQEDSTGVRNRMDGRHSRGLDNLRDKQ